MPCYSPRRRQFHQLMETTNIGIHDMVTLPHSRRLITVYHGPQPSTSKIFDFPGDFYEEEEEVAERVNLVRYTAHPKVSSEMTRYRRRFQAAYMEARVNGA